MRPWLKHPLRVTGRLFWLGGVLALAAINFFVQSAARSPTARAAWMQRTASNLLPLFRLQPQVTGDIPSRGLLICNHLGYLDILLLGSLVPTVFVSKSEVKGWPVFGWFARGGGTIFVQREKRTQVGQVMDEIQTVLKEGVRVVLFPEGTSSDGRTVLPLKSALLEPATQTTHPLAVGLIRYTLDDGDAAKEVCYWKDMTLFPHLINLLSKRSVSATVCFKALGPRTVDRKERFSAVFGGIEVGGG